MAEWGWQQPDREDVVGTGKAGRNTQNACPSLGVVRFRRPERRRELHVSKDTELKAGDESRVNSEQRKRKLQTTQREEVECKEFLRGRVEENVVLRRS
jgi:hypothetical protein